MREGEVMRAASAYRLRVKKRHRNAMAVVSVASPPQTRSFPTVLQVAFTFVLHHSDTFFPRLKYICTFIIISSHTLLFITVVINNYS